MDELDKAKAKVEKIRSDLGKSYAMEDWDGILELGRELLEAQEVVRHLTEGR